MNIRTVYFEILREMHLDATTPATKTVEDVMRAIVDSMEYNRQYETPFNKKYYEVSLESERSRYPLPPDFIRISGTVFRVNSTDGYQLPLRATNINQIEEYRWKLSNDDGEPTELTGAPDFYAIDGTTNELVVNPSPGSTDPETKIRFNYIADLGTPTMEHNGTNFLFYEPGTTTTITAGSSTYTNAWLVQGKNVTKRRALYYLWSSPYGTTEGSEAKAARALVQWQEALKSLEREAAGKNRGAGVRAHI